MAKTTTKTAAVDLAALLAEGRKILAERDAQAMADDEACKKELQAHWQNARSTAIAAFGPLAEFGVQPEAMPEGWAPDRHEETDGCRTFFVRPFETGGKITVEVKSHWSYGTGTTGGSLVWKARRLEVETAWLATRGGSAEDCWLSAEGEWVDSHAEAVAICERHIGDYVEALRQLNIMKAGWKPRQPDTAPEKTLEERLLDVLREFVVQYSPQSE